MEENIKYVQTSINSENKPNLENFSGCGGRSCVDQFSDVIDTWNSAEDAIADGKQSYKPKVIWGVFMLDMSSRKLLKCCYCNKKNVEVIL